MDENITSTDHILSTFLAFKGGEGRGKVIWTKSKRTETVSYIHPRKHWIFLIIWKVLEHYFFRRRRIC